MNRRDTAKGKRRIRGSLLGLCVALAIVAVAPAAAATADAKPAPCWVDDFDDANQIDDLFGLTGPWQDGASKIQFDFPAPGADGMGHCLRLRYHLAPGTAGCGWWMDLAPRWEGAEPLRDLSGLRYLCLALRASPPLRGRGVSLGLQLQNAEGHSVVQELASPGKQWSRVTLDLQQFEGVELARARRIAVVLRPEGRKTMEGELHLDDLQMLPGDGGAVAPSGDAALLDLLERRTFAFFPDNAHPRTGLVSDLASDPRRASIAAMGYALAAYCLGSERGWLARPRACALAAKMLKTLASAQQSDSPQAAGFHGFFYHFLDMSTARRWGNCELSSVDTAILAAGLLACRQYFDGQGDEAEVRALADRLYRAIDWPWMLDRRSRLFRMAWRPEKGFSGRWNYYTDEALLICLLAMASPTHPVPAEVLYAWKRLEGRYDDCGDIIQSWTGSLFTYFSASLWVDLRGRKDDHPVRPVDWWENSRRAARANRRFCLDRATDFASYSAGLWGLSAGLGPHGYVGDYGAPPCGNPGGPHHDGTIAPFALAMALPALGPQASEALGPLRKLLARPKTWGVYGFRDGVNLGRSLQSPADDWYAHDYIGLDQGMALLGLDAYREGLIWRLMTKSEYLRPVLEKHFPRVAEK